VLELLQAVVELLLLAAVVALLHVELDEGGARQIQELPL
jgi:hypothetical protein